MTVLPPIRREVLVPAGPETAFAVFTARIAAWWPLASHSVHGEQATVAFRDGVLVETGPDGTESVWGEVLDWQPPRRLRITWHPGYEAERASEVTVSFEPAPDGRTLVTLTHARWERFADPAAARDEYGTGWPVVLARYAGSSLAWGP